MPERLKILVAYDGSEFKGWQSQLHRNTIQDHLERAFCQITGNRVGVHGAGRTDSGVHALAQCAHVDLLDRRLPASKYPAALNAILPAQIRVLRARYVSRNFHARFSAKGKVYRYRICAGPVLPPHEFQRAWHIATPLDFNLIQTASKHFLGKHDFAAFAANRGKSKRQHSGKPFAKTSERDTTRTIRSVRVRRRGPCITMEFDGDGFLYKMVRLMVGATIEVARGKVPVADFADRLNSGRARGERFVAPAEGLFLVRVWY